MDLFNRSWFGKGPEVPKGDLNSTKTKVIEAWLSNLPKANLQVCADLLARALEFLQNELMALDSPAKESKQRQAVEEWHANIELIRPVINYVSEQLRLQYYSNLSSSPKDKRKIMAVAQVLQMILAKTYYTLAVHPMTHSHPQVQATSIQRGIRHLTEIIYHNYQIYYPAPKECWLMLYDLYQQAELNQLEQIPVRDDSTPERMPMTVSNAFKVPLMLSTCNPFQLHPTDLDKLMICIEHWTVFVAVHKEPQHDDLYVTRLDKDEPPIFIKLAKVTEGIPALRGINISAVAMHINGLLVDVDSQNTSFVQIHGLEISSNVLRHLAQVWTQMPTRAFPRRAAQSALHQTAILNTVVGMSAIHYFLNGEQSEISRCVATNRLDEEAKPQPHSQRIVGPKIPSIQDFAFQIEARAPDHAPITHEKPKSPQIPKYEMRTWQLLNTSNNGYCLCTTDDYPKAISPGELVAIQEQAQNQAPYWHLGIVRWIKHQSDGQVHMGIQLISPNAVAVGIQNQRQILQKQDALAALYLPKIEAYHQEQTIITPTVPYQVGNHARIANHFIDTDIILVREVECNPNFKRFEFTTQQHFGKSFDAFES